MDENDTAGDFGGDRLLRLLALDGHDLEVISAHLQEAHVRRGDLRYLPRERRFALALHRFDWEREADAPPRRRLAALHFEQVRAVRHRNLAHGNLAHDDPDSPLSLLAVYFVEGDSPSGAVILEFAGGAAIRLDVECIEAQMKDLGPEWEVDSGPAHAHGVDELKRDGGSDAGET